MRRGRKLRQRLGDGGLPGSDLTARPKGMWRRTYNRITGEIDAYEHCGLLGWEQVAERLLKRIDNKAGYWK